jgi:hypothetical protein
MPLLLDYLLPAIIHVLIGDHDLKSFVFGLAWRQAFHPVRSLIVIISNVALVVYQTATHL